MVKLSEEVVVKFGGGVTIEEANNQSKVFELLHHNIVCVPQVYRFFDRILNCGYPPSGFIVIGYVYGKVLQFPDKSQIGQIAQIISYFSCIQGQHRGPLQGGVSHGLLWEENGERTACKTVRQIEKWLNFRLLDVESILALAKYTLVLCDLDLAPQNIIRLKGGSLCFLD